MRWGCRGFISMATSETCSILLAFVKVGRSKSGSCSGLRLLIFSISWSPIWRLCIKRTVNKPAYLVDSLKVRWDMGRIGGLDI